jgi:hypothetical protein
VVKYVRWHGLTCSSEWAVVLDWGIAQGYIRPSDVNSLHRTMAEQEQMVREKGIYNSLTNPHGAARPNPAAPHIKIGRKDHAADINDGAVDRLVAGLRRKGFRVLFTVSTEPWHVEFVNEAELVRAAKALDDPLKGFREDEARWIREYVKLKQANKDRDRRRVLRRVMTERRQAIYRAHKPLTGLNLKRWRTLRHYTS